MTRKELKKLTDQNRESRFVQVKGFLFEQLQKQAEAGYNITYLELPTSFKQEIIELLTSDGFEITICDNKNPMFTNFTISW